MCKCSGQFIAGHCQVIVILSQEINQSVIYKYSFLKPSTCCDGTAFEVVLTTSHFCRLFVRHLVDDWFFL